MMVSFHFLGNASQGYSTGYSNSNYYNQGGESHANSQQSYPSSYSSYSANTSGYGQGNQSQYSYGGGASSNYGSSYSGGGGGGAGGYQGSAADNSWYAGYGGNQGYGSSEGGYGSGESPGAMKSYYGSGGGYKGQQGHGNNSYPYPQRGRGGSARGRGRGGSNAECTLKLGWFCPSSFLHPTSYIITFLSFSSVTGGSQSVPTVTQPPPPPKPKAEKTPRVIVIDPVEFFALGKSIKPKNASGVLCEILGPAWSSECIQATDEDYEEFNKTHGYYPSILYKAEVTVRRERLINR